MDRAPPTRHVFQPGAPKPKPPPMKFTLCKKDNTKKLEQMNIRKGYAAKAVKGYAARQGLGTESEQLVVGHTDSFENEIQREKVIVVSESWCPFAASAKKLLQ